MSTSEVMVTATFLGGADLTANQFRPVIMSADGMIDPAGDAAEPVVGIQVSEPSTDAVGTAVTVCIGGICKVVAGGTITAGDALATDTGADVATAATGEARIGIALESAVVNDIFRMLVSLHGDAP